MLLLSVCLLAILSLGATQPCSELQQSELGGMNGLIAALVLIGDNPAVPTVTVNNFTIVCLAAASTQDRYRDVSVVVDYVCSGNPNCIPSPAQFDFQCVTGSWAAGSPEQVQGTPATGTLTTTRRTDCSFCFGSSFAASSPAFGIDPATVDSETHCTPCHPSCPGLCTGPGANQCCNVFMNNMCEDNCDNGFEPLNGECVVSCDPLDDIPNGRVVLTTTFVNSVATYECDTGYNLSEDVTRTCVDNGGTGNWSMSEPTCIIVDCGNLPDPDNGNVNHPTTTFDSTATYSCNSGFELSGNEPRMCQADGTWDGSEPTCDDLCDGVNCVNGNCNNGVCICDPGYTGTLCDEAIPDPCDNVPCVNGICSNGVCTCNSGFTGPPCEAIPDPCDNVPCVNGICSNGVCTCNSGFTGPPCVCICGNRCNAMCECMPSFYVGERCETCNCDPDRCMTGSGPDFVCNCLPEYHGEDCSTSCNVTIPFCKECSVNEDGIVVCTQCQPDYVLDTDTVMRECKLPDATSAPGSGGGGGCGGACIGAIIGSLLGLLLLAAIIAAIVFAVYKYYTNPATQVKKQDTEGLNGVARDNPLYVDPTTVEEEVGGGAEAAEATGEA